MVRLYFRVKIRFILTNLTNFRESTAIAERETHRFILFTNRVKDCVRTKTNQEVKLKVHTILAKNTRRKCHTGFTFDIHVSRERPERLKSFP